MASLVKQLVVLAALAGAGGWAAATWLDPADEGGPGRRAFAPPLVSAEAARLGRVERAVSAVGSGRARRSVELRMAEDGRITDLMFGPGDRVRDGEPLVRLDDAVERAALAEAQAELSETEAAFERAETLRDQGRITGSAFETAESERLRAAARADSARAALERRTLRAPFDGVVGFTDMDVGAFVTRADAIATLDDLSFLDADFAVPERNFGEVEIGDAVRARSSAFPDDPIEGEVVAVDRRVDEVSRAFRVRARFANPGLRLPAGLFLQLELVLDAREAVLAPEEALVTVGGASHVWVLGEDDAAERRAVRVGQRRAGEAEILDGLEAGERVVTRGVQKVRPGQPVRLMERDGAPGGATADAGPQPDPA